MNDRAQNASRSGVDVFLARHPEAAAPLRMPEPVFARGSGADTIAPRVTVLAAVALFAVVVLAAGCGGAKEKRGDAAAEDALNAPARLAATDIAIATRLDLAAGIPVSGSLEPAIDVRITAPVTEMIDRVLVKEGDAVTRGQVLAHFRTASLEPSASSADAEFKMRAADRERMQNLLKEGAVSERDVESAEAAWRAAVAQRAQAHNRLADATVRATVAGVIATRFVQGGDRVADGDPLFRLVNTRELEFEATVPSEYVQSIQPGAAVELTITGYTAGTVTGRVARVNAAADPATRQVKVYVIVDNRNGALVGGLFASGSLVTQQLKDVIAVPVRAIRVDGARNWVMIVQKGFLARREVTPGLADEAQDRVEISAGLAPGDTVIVGTLEGLTPGRPVIVGGGER